MQYTKIILTYAEIFNRCHDWREFECLGVNPWYLNEGGDPKETKSFQAKAARFMGIYEDFGNRSISNEYPPDLTDEEFEANYECIYIKSEIK